MAVPQQLLQQLLALDENVRRELVATSRRFERGIA